MTPHSRKLGSVFEGRADGHSFVERFSSGVYIERQRTKQTNTGAEVKKEADRDNEAKSAQAKNYQSISQRIFGQDPG
jgi:hypothetical protein